MKIEITENGTGGLTMAEKEYIERESVFNAMMNTMCGTGYQARALDVIAFAPAADVVKVVRCKDCTYYDCIDNLCDLRDFEVPNDMFYCHDGFMRN
ncbi:MAG: hypothetical protein ACI4KF_08045 [Huintestinicola sp.]